MILRAFVLLALAIGVSVAASIYFGADVLIALGLILTQLKLLGKKVALIKMPAVLAWLKLQAATFFRIELLKKWIMTTLLPLLLGKAALRRIAAFLGQYRRAVRKRYMGLLRWYRNLHPFEKVVAAIIILCATVAISVTSLGLWLLLFSVKLPLWIAAVSAAFGRMVWVSFQKTVFRAVAFLQLRWLWRLISRILPARWLAWKRRYEFRLARKVVRRRRMTLQQLSDRKDSLPFRLGIMIDYLRGTGGPGNSR